MLREAAVEAEMTNVIQLFIYIFVILVLSTNQSISQKIDDETSCAIGRSKKCSIKLAIKRGLFQTGLTPQFPEGLNCREIDEGWAISYTYKRNREAYHGGIDMPAPYGTPMIAAADGVVVGKYGATNSARGIELVLQHSPEDTGIPLWIYTQYGHFNQMPNHKIGQRVRMGDVLGPTGNSGRDVRTGKQSKRRRPAIHFAVVYSRTKEYQNTKKVVIPAAGNWMDPIALYQNELPFDSHSMKALPSKEKQVRIPVKVDDGSFMPRDTKLVWPYECSTGPLKMSPKQTRRSGGGGKCKSGDLSACRSACKRGREKACRRLKRGR